MPSAAFCGNQEETLVTVLVRNILGVRRGFPGSSTGKEFTCNAGHPSSIPGSGRSTGEGIGYPLQHSGLENSTDCIVRGVTESDMNEQLSPSRSKEGAEMFLLFKNVKTF